mmetsp:Transcript_118040/g.328152  ORF Transcript_118040/g.328152 Transcript_118040/m.328152 type:complete len:285 (+) Transcript_118040:482-1336(+)
MHEPQEKQEPRMDGPHGGLRGHEEEDRRRDGDGHEHRELCRQRPAVHRAVYREVVADDAPQYASDAGAHDLEGGDQSSKGPADADVLKVHGREGHGRCRDSPEDALADQHQEGGHPHVAEELLGLVQHADALGPPRPRLFIDAHHNRYRDEDAHHRNAREGHPPTSDTIDLLAGEGGDHDKRQGLPDRHVAEVDATEVEAHLVLCRHLRDDGLDDGREKAQRHAVQRAEQHHEVEGLDERQCQSQRAPQHRACGQQPFAWEARVRDGAPERAGDAHCISLANCE